MKSGSGDLGTIGFVGLGDMGGGIAANYADKGFDLLAYDLRPEMEAEVTGWGGRWANSSEDLLQQSDVFCLCLVDDKQVRGFIDQQQAFERLRPGSIVVMHGTVSPRLMRDLTQEGRDHGIEMVDAPVSGGHTASVAGALTVMVGAQPRTFDRLRPLWEAMSSRSYRIADEPGTGQVVKLCNNMMGLTINLLVLEAIQTARAYGIEETTMLDVARASSGNSWMIENWGTTDRLLLGHPHATVEEGFAILLKDIRTAVQIGADAGVEPQIASFATTTGERLLAERQEHLREAARKPER